MQEAADVSDAGNARLADVQDFEEESHDVSNQNENVSDYDDDDDDDDR